MSDCDIQILTLVQANKVCAQWKSFDQLKAREMNVKNIRPG